MKKDFGRSRLPVTPQTGGSDGAVSTSFIVFLQTGSSYGAYCNSVFIIPAIAAMKKTSVEVTCLLRRKQEAPMEP